jgi:iron complex transport system substrate-binding protein
MAMLRRMPAGLRGGAMALLLCLLALPALAGQRPAERIVALDWGLAETLLALGVTPIGIPEIDAYRHWVVEPALPPSVIDVGLRVEPNLELLRQMAPDLILIISEQEELRPMLERIAPTLTLSTYTPEGKPYEAAVEATRALARAIGREAEGEALLARAEAGFAQARAALRDRRERRLYVVTFLDARHVRIFGARSLPQDVLDRIGLRNAWDGATNEWGFTTAGVEHLAAAPDARLVAIEPVPEGTGRALANSPLWSNLPFVRAGAVHRIPPTLVFGMVPSAERFARMFATLPPDPGDAHGRNRHDWDSHD